MEAKVLELAAAICHRPGSAPGSGRRDHGPAGPVTGGGPLCGRADELANLVAWRLSDEASCLYGATHLIDSAFNA
jgi:hypothetical protein